MIKPCTLKYWKERGEVYVGHLDGVICVYTLKTIIDNLTFVGSFKMHQDSVHSIHILNDLNFAISSGFDSSLKVWQPPEEWEKKIVVTASMLHNVDPKENLSTIREECESLEPESLLNRYRITNNWADPKGDKVVESILQQFK